MKTPQIHCWREPVDDKVFAVIARCYMLRSRYVYGLSCFVLADRASHHAWQYREIGESRLREILAKDHAGRLPYCCHVSEPEARFYGVE